MLREITIPKSENFIFHIPKEYVNQEIEFIAFPINQEKKKIGKRFGYGVMAGKMKMSDNFNEPLELFEEYM